MMGSWFLSNDLKQISDCISDAVWCYQSEQILDYKQQCNTIFFHHTGCVL